MVRVPTHGPLGLTQTEFAEKLGVSYPRVNELRLAPADARWARGGRPSRRCFQRRDGGYMTGDGRICFFTPTGSSESIATTRSLGPHPPELVCGASPGFAAHELEAQLSPPQPQLVSQNRSSC